MNRLILPLQIITLIGCLLLYGCGGEPFTYEPDNELKPGPGLFSGEDGEFNLIGSPKDKENKEEEEDTHQEEQKKE
jgi:hypothetical protein